MSELTSKFSRDDLETLIESIGDWEMLGNQEYHFLQMIEDAAMPPEDHEAYEVMERIKDHYRSKKQQILGNRQMRQEKAVFLKAKLMLVRRDMEINDLFEMTTTTPGEISIDPHHVSPPHPIAAPKPVAGASEKLELAEFFIKDLGVWEHYQKFLAEKEEKGPPEPDVSVN